MGGHAIQLLVALVVAISLYLVVFLFDEKKMFFFLAFMIPFQIIDSQYGSLNFVMTVTFSVALLFKFHTRSLPIATVGALVTFSFFGFLFAEMLALTQVPKALWKSNFFFIVNMAGNYALLFLAVNLIKTERDLLHLIYWLAASTLAVNLYCVMQGVLGFQGYAIMDIQELSMKTIRGDSMMNSRILGPFMNTQSFVGYMVLQTMFMIYCRFVLAQKLFQKWIWSILILFSLVVLIASNTRTGFLSFIIGMILTIIFLAKRISIGKSVYLLISGTVALSLASYVVVTYTSYNRLFNRLSNTEIRGLEVDTRKGLIPAFLKEIAEKPLIGHRPMYGIPPESSIKQKLSPPHNLFLYLLYTTGIIGFSFFMLFLLSVFLKLCQAARWWADEKFLLKSLPSFCMLLLMVFLVQQYFISFIRWEIRDYQQYLFLLFGLFCAFPKIAESN